MKLKRIALLVVLAITCICAAPLSANDAPPAPGNEGGMGNEGEMVVLPFQEENFLNMTEFLHFSGKILGISFLFIEAETADVRFQFTDTVKIPRADFPGYFERLLLENGFIYSQSGHGVGAIHRIIRINMRSSEMMSLLKASTEVVSLSDLDNYKDRGTLITVSIPLKYLYARELMTSLNFYFTNQQIESIRPDERTNSVIITSTAAKVCRINRLIQLMDVESKAAPEAEWITKLETLQKRVIALEKQLEDVRALKDQGAK